MDILFQCGEREGGGYIVAHPVLWAFCFLWLRMCTQISRSLTNCWPNLYPIRPRILLLLLVGRAIEKDFSFHHVCFKDNYPTFSDKKKKEEEERNTLIIFHHLSLTSLGMFHQLNKESISPRVRKRAGPEKEMTFSLDSAERKTEAVESCYREKAHQQLSDAHNDRCKWG